MDELKNNGVRSGCVSGAAADQTADHSPDMLRREFLKRFGVYAAGSAAGLCVLMSARTSVAVGSATDEEPP